MIKKFALTALAALLIIIIIILVNTFRNAHALPVRQASPLAPLPDSAIAHMQEAVRIPTISYADTLPVDTAAYLSFRNFMERAYPLVHQKLQRQVFNQFSYLYTWKGTNPSLPPYVIMAHSDVVPVEPGTENKWHVPPFSGSIKDSMIYGRGVIDDKGCLVPILEAAEQLLAKNFQPERTLYLSFGHDEEISGQKGAQAIANWFKSQNIRPAMVIDEGGEISVEQFSSLHRPIAFIGVAEKGYLSFRLTVEKAGGHSSMPEKETAIDILSRALVKLRHKQMPFHITAPMAAMLDKVQPGLPFMERAALSNQWLFGNFVQQKFESNNVVNSLFHTTIVPTIINSGVKDNVIPSMAVAVVNSRNLPGDSQQDVIDFMKKQIHDDRVKIAPEKINKEASPVTPVDGAAMKKVEDLCYQVMPDVVPVPYILMGGTDSYDFNGMADAIIKFAPSIDGKGYHGIDERLPISDFQRMYSFYSLLMQQSGK